MNFTDKYLLPLILREKTLKYKEGLVMRFSKKLQISFTYVSSEVKNQYLLQIFRKLYL